MTYYTILSITYLFVITMDLVILYIKGVFKKSETKIRLFSPTKFGLFILALTGLFTGNFFFSITTSKSDYITSTALFCLMLLTHFITNSFIVVTEKYLSFSFEKVNIKEIQEITVKEGKTLSRIYIKAYRKRYTTFILIDGLTRFKNHSSILPHI